MYTVDVKDGAKKRLATISNLTLVLDVFRFSLKRALSICLLVLHVEHAEREAKHDPHRLREIGA